MPSTDLHEMIKIKQRKPVVYLRVRIWGLGTKLITTKLVDGVEHTRLETKAKDTKTSEAKDSLSKDRPFGAQGQECQNQGQVQGYNAEVISKKCSSLQNFVNFSENSSIL